MLFFQIKFKILIILCYIYMLFKNLSFTKNKLNNQKSKICYIKNELYNLINKNLKKNISYIDSLYIIGKYRFGNFLISLNNAILFCEFFFCKRIIIKSNQRIFINPSKICYRHIIFEH